MRTIFWGFGAYIARIIDDVQYDCWLMHHDEIVLGNFDQTKTIRIDLSRNPTNVPWPDVQIDSYDYSEDPHIRRTTIGPIWPSDKLYGAVYLEENYARSQHLTMPPAGFPGAFDYEFKTEEFWGDAADPRDGRRYYGFHAKIITKGSSPAEPDLVTIFKAGSGRSVAARTEWLSLGDIKRYDALVPDGMTEIGGASGALEGALFIEEEYAKSLDLMEPKVPASAVELRLRRNVFAKDPPDCTKLQQSRLNVSSAPTYGEVLRIQDAIANEDTVEGEAQFKSWLGRLVECEDIPDSPKSLDLIAHSVDPHNYLRLGQWNIDGSSASVLKVFQDMKAGLKNLGVSQVRLLGCRTARGEGRKTIRAIQDVLEDIEVFGTNTLLYQSDFEAGGFKDGKRYKLLGRNVPLRESRLQDLEWPDDAQVVGPLRLDALPSFSSGALPDVAWATRTLAHELLPFDISGIIDTRAGRALPGLLTVPSLEVRIPTKRGRYNRMQVLFDGAMVRVYPNEPPDGDHNHRVISVGVCYRVLQPFALKALLAGRM